LVSAIVDMSAKRTTRGKSHRFGGDWTTAKLEVVAAYLSSYTTALKNKPSKEHPFVKGYIDAFAGTGYRDAPQDKRPGSAPQAVLFPDLASHESQAFLDGSARLALKTQPDSTATCSSNGAHSAVRNSKR